MMTWLFSDMGTIKSYRTMKGAGVNTYKWINAEGKSKLIKYHWIPMAGEETIDRFEAEKLAGIDPDIASRDLFDTLAQGKTVEYELRVQMMDEDEDDLDFDPLDTTKEIQYRMLNNFLKADQEFGRRIAKGLGLNH